MERKLRFSILFLLLLVGTAVKAAEWIDQTEKYIVNPSFTGNSIKAWTMVDTWAGSTACNYGCQEFWQGVWNFYQTLSVPNGKYRVSVYGYHRPKGNTTTAVNDYDEGNGEYITSFLYANEDEVALKSVYAHYLSQNYNNGCWSYRQGMVRRYYPNNMESAAYCFAQGYYNNELETTVTNGQLTIGIRNDEYVESNWTIFTGWRLEWWGEAVKVTSVTLDKTQASLVPGERLQLNATVAPSDATVSKLTWKSSNTAVATVDQNGLVLPLATGTAKITATATDGSGKQATCNITVTTNSSGLAQLMVTELQAANLDQWVDPSWNYGGWVELYNPSSRGVTLTNCWLSDEGDNLKKICITQPTAIPAKSYGVLWLEHHDKYCLTQLDLKLDAEGDTLFLSNSNGKLILSLTYPPAISRCSYARKSLTGDEWAWTANPTPGDANDGQTYSDMRMETPTVNQPTQIYGGSLTVSVNIPTGATLRYTTDGSTPTETNGQISTTGLFYPTETTTYRFRLFGEGFLPSAVVTRTYILEDKTFDLPIISVVGNEKDLYSEDMGLFVEGNGNGRPGNGMTTPCNWNMDWDRTVNFEYLNEEGEMCINQETAMERCGGWSRAWKPYSFKLKANKRYELKSYLPYEFYPEKPYRKHKTLQIRNGGNDNTCRIKDPALQEIIRRSGIDIETQAYRPVMHYINGRYAGVINMREPNNKHYVYANYGLDEEEIDQFEISPDSGYVQKCGTYESMQRWYDLAAECGTDEEAYEEIRQMVDIDEFCNYMAVEFYLGGTDWPKNNVKGWKPIMEGGKYRFVIFDLDHAFSTASPFIEFANKQVYTFDKLYGEPVQNITKEIELVTIFLNMLENDHFRKQFIDTYCLVTGSVFEPTRCKDIINELANRVSDSQSIWNEVYNTSSTPWGTANNLISNLSTSRQQNLINALRNYAPMQLSGMAGQKVKLSANIPEASLQVNELPVPTNQFSGTLFAPITLRAQAPIGYKFLGWQMVEGSSQSSTEILPAESQWQYYDQGSLDGQNWASSNYDASGWDTGKAPLGYFVGGDRYTNTYLDYGSSTNEKRPTYYLRHQLALDQTPSADDIFTLNYSIDDGFVIYVNGTEAGRYNMPDGTISYSTFATTYAQNNPDTGSMSLSANLFKKGTNTIAVEIHNNAANSTDIYWEASISRSATSATGEYVSTEETMELPTGNMTLLACYGEMTEKEKRDAGITTSPVVVNEVSAGNSIYVNEYGKKDDWVELYNTTDEDIDLEGMYLTDRSDKPTKYQITAKGTKASTIIPAHGHKIIWCSKRNTNTELHANFKLDNEDGTVIRLMAKDKSWADSLVYCAMNGDQTVGRYPDGAQQVYQMLPTIKAPNNISTYATAWEYVKPDGISSPTLSSRSGSMSIAYTAGQLLVKSEDTDKAEVSVYTMGGALVLQQQLTLLGGHARISVSELPAGIYIARAKNHEGDECATKFLLTQ